MEIRCFEPEDAVELSRLIVQNLQQVLIQDYSRAAIEKLMPAFSPDKLIEDAVSQFTLVGMLGPDIVGTAALAGDRVRSVFVDMTRHRTGIGKALMTALEDHARQQHLESIYLMAGLSACGFYEKLGYSTVKRIEHEMDGIPLPVMRMEKGIAPRAK